MSVRHPEIQWAHNNRKVFLKILLQEAKDIKIDTEDQKVVFEAKVVRDCLLCDHG